MKGSWRFARIAGIDVYLHWTFMILIIWLALAHLWRGWHFMTFVNGLIFIIAIFACIVLHELGHALMARRFGIQTRDITLLPIGGLARLERMPREPWQEFMVAIAGPAVNVGLAAFFFLALIAINGMDRLLEQLALQTQVINGPLLVNLLIVNIVLVVFNLLPAFPMDGGRVLRAILAHRMDYTRATDIAARVGQAMAIVFGIVGLFGNALLVLVAAFVYLGAEAESRMVKMKAILAGLTVREAMMTQFRTLRPEDTLGKAADELLAGTQINFPVVADGQLLGMLRQQAIVRGIREGGVETPVTSVMEADVEPVDEWDMVDGIAERMRQEGSQAIPVVSGQQLTGLLSLENIGELVMIRAALRDTPHSERTAAAVNPHPREPLDLEKVG